MKYIHNSCIKPVFSFIIVWCTVTWNSNLLHTLYYYNIPAHEIHGWSWKAVKQHTNYSTIGYMHTKRLVKIRGNQFTLKHSNPHYTTAEYGWLKRRSMKKWQVFPQGKVENLRWLANKIKQDRQCTYSIEVFTHSHCCSGKAKSITQLSVCFMFSCPWISV